MILLRYGLIVGQHIVLFWKKKRFEMASGYVFRRVRSAQRMVSFFAVRVLRYTWQSSFESILSHGFVVDGKGMKMSKSMGNVISPEDILKNYGADILRVWVAASDYAEDLRIDKSILTQHAESYRKIRNTFRFMLGNLNDKFEPQNFEKLNIKDFDELEQYILHKVFT